jgi:hypothetical protein
MGPPTLWPELEVKGNEKKVPERNGKFLKSLLTALSETVLTAVNEQNVLQMFKFHQN